MMDDLGKEVGAKWWMTSERKSGEMMDDLEYPRLGFIQQAMVLQQKQKWDLS